MGHPAVRTLLPAPWPPALSWDLDALIIQDQTKAHITSLCLP